MCEATPLLAVTVTAKLPAEGEEHLNMELEEPGRTTLPGLRLHWYAGAATDRATIPVKPFTLVTVTRDDPATPARIGETIAGSAEMAKSVTTTWTVA